MIKTFHSIKGFFRYMKKYQQWTKKNNNLLQNWAPVIQQKLPHTYRVKLLVRKHPAVIHRWLIAKRFHMIMMMMIVTGTGKNQNFYNFCVCLLFHVLTSRRLPQSNFYWYTQWEWTLKRISTKKWRHLFPKKKNYKNNKQTYIHTRT